MNWKIATSVLGVLAVIGTFGYANIRTQDTNVSAKFADPGEEQLTVSPQEARSSVLIDRAVFATGGFVVVRGSDGKRLGQIIEISTYLEAGIYENITISLGEFYTYKQGDQLIAMIYQDDGDTLFSELDQLSSSDTAVFVKTGETVPAATFDEQVASHSGTGMETVRYTKGGFQPTRLIVPVGTMVEFINQSDKQMWVASSKHPSHELLPTFDQFKGVGAGENYMYTFDKKGTWSYHDHINPALEGAIIVE